jgi:hypothetical protein
MAETPADDARRQRIPAYAMLRAAVTMNQDTAFLLVAEAQRNGTLPQLMLDVAHLAARAMLGSEGYDTARVLQVVDGWLDVAAHGVPGPSGRRDGRPAA